MFLITTFNLWLPIISCLCFNNSRAKLQFQHHFHLAANRTAECSEFCVAKQLQEHSSSIHVLLRVTLITFHMSYLHLFHKYVLNMKQYSFFPARAHSSDLKTSEDYSFSLVNAIQLHLCSILRMIINAFSTGLLLSLHFLITLFFSNSQLYPGSLL